MSDLSTRTPRVFQIPLFALACIVTMLGQAGSGAAQVTSRMVALSGPTLRVTLTTDKPVYAPGEPIRIVFEVANHTAAPVTLDFASAQRFDLAIADESGAEVWRWSAGRMFAQMLGQEVLGPETGRLSYEATFAGALGPGRYRIEARLTDRSGDFSASLGVEVK